VCDPQGGDLRASVARCNPKSALPCRVRPAPDAFRPVSRDPVRAAGNFPSGKDPLRGSRRGPGAGVDLGAICPDKAFSSRRLAGADS